MTAPPQVAVGLLGAGRIGKIHGETLATRVPGARFASSQLDTRCDSAFCQSSWYAYTCG